MTTNQMILGIKIAEAQLRLTKSHGRDGFLPGVYDRLIAEQEARLAERVAALAATKEAAA